MHMLIGKGTLTSNALRGDVAVISGAGRGIGREAARSLAWLGAEVVISEIDEESGAGAAEDIRRRFGDERAVFVHTDVGDSENVRKLHDTAVERYGKIDIVVNNAAITPMGSVEDVPIGEWDASYRVNLRGPVLMAQAFVPGMSVRGHGVFVCVSSVGHAYMAAYEAFKLAQLHLAETLDAELEGSGVCAFTIAPGLVHTPGALEGIRKLAPLYGMSVEEFLKMSEEHMLSPEAAGAGFAASVVFAERYRGQEINAKQALTEAGIEIENPSMDRSGFGLTPEQVDSAMRLTRSIRATLEEQSNGWKERSIFERQWMFRDFKKNAGMSVERWLSALDEIEQAMGSREGFRSTADAPPLDRLSAYYAHLKTLAAGYEKDPDKLEKHGRIIES
jgi:NAD(P)-dependent dehydrogenase (short-subunit alcohol dehydrogenase family)